MPGFKVWASGERLTATDVNGFLMRQTVVQCTSTTRPSSPAEGMHIYETDTHHLLRYDGSAWSGLQSSELRATGAGGVPRLYLKATDAAADEKVWDVAPSSGTLLFRAINDAENATDTWMTVTRTGVTVTQVEFSADVAIAGGGLLLDDAGSGVRFNGEMAVYADGSKVYVGAVEGTRPGVFRGGEVDIFEADATGDARFAQTPGTTHESFRVANRAQLSGRGFSVNTDSAGFAGGVTAGISVAVNRADPAAEFNNAAGDALQAYSGSTPLLTAGQIGAVDNTALWLGWKSHDGTVRFKQVRATQSGDIDGTTRRYLYVVES